MIFGWFVRRRKAELAAAGRLVSAADLRNGAAPRPVQLVAVNLGSGLEVWAHYAVEPRFRKKDRTLDDAQMVVLDGDDSSSLAAALGVPLKRLSVKF